jgi:AmmeMemoRadiSam system protein B
MTRKAVVAGMFYEDNEEKLDNQITKCFKSDFGPGRIPEARKEKKILGVVAPHAGYQFSGPGQAHCYKEIGEAEEADVYVILGTAHSGFETAALTMEDFETPYGIVKVDEDFAKNLIEKGAAIEDKYPHVREHSIEVQLPFLQFVNKDKEIKIVPIVVGHNTNHKKLGRAIADISKLLGKKIIIIASSDFTHYGISYGYMPFKDNVKENLEKLDKRAIKWLEKLDEDSFLMEIEEKQMTVCGAKAIAAMIVACKELGADKVRVLEYYSSGDITKDWGSAVGYASIIVE